MADESMTAVPARLSSSSSFEAGEDDGGSDHETRSRSGTGELNGRRVPPGAGDTAADVAEADEFRLRLLEAVLGLYSNHPMNYGELEARYHALSLFLCALPYYESIELKSLALKTLEVICVSFKVCICVSFCVRIFVSLCIWYFKYYDESCPSLDEKRSCVRMLSLDVIRQTNASGK